LDPACSCSTCARFSRAYLRHLYTSGEILSAMLMTHHNVSFYLQLMQRIRNAIKEGCFPQLYREILPTLQEPASLSARSTGNQDRSLATPELAEPVPAAMDEEPTE